ncbi:aminotransferase class V-fold PLP-dependent enzyme [Halobacteriovorax sp. HFRX-2_2]|uniref:cysteine desulfurase family protein n=1 Tax=unclassified Halobacteriovorax TaxID=2639665 RepID=UPI0037178A9B
MKLINNYLYLDYNATAPLVKPVQDWLCEGAVYFGNPASIHQVGKKSKSLINQTIKKIQDTFNATKYDVFFHSGATEAINSVVKGFCFNALKAKSSFHVFCFDVDHSSMVNQKEHVELLGGTFHVLKTHSGDFDTQEVIQALNKCEGEKLINFTYVNNENGVVWDLDEVLKVKEETGACVHVDCVQVVGKIKDWDQLTLGLDYYTFSGHKFGALKGVGFTLVSKEASWTPLIRGGGQQKAMRSGTENAFSVYTINLALDYNLSHSNIERTQGVKDEIEKWLVENFGSNITLIGAKAKKRNATTIFFSVHNKNINTVMMALDMAGICASSGSACASGIIKPSRIAKAYDLSDEAATNVIRFSLSPFSQEAETIISKLNPVLSKFLS